MGRPVTVTAPFSDPGAPGHTATLLTNGMGNVTAEVTFAEGRGTARARLTPTAAGLFDATMAVCGPQGSPPCGTTPVQVLVAESAAPLIEVWPALGSTAGGNHVRATGRFVEGVRAVHVGGASVEFEAADGTVTFGTPPAAAGATTVPVTVTTAAGTSNEAPFGYVDNAPPVPAGVHVSTPRSTPVTIDLPAADPEGDEVQVRVSTAPAHGTTAAGVDGAVVYTPEDGFDGTDAFSFVAEDATGVSAPATVTVRVGNLAPTAVDEEVVLDLGTADALGRLTLPAAALLANDQHPEGDHLRIVAALGGLQAHGQVMLDSAGDVDLVPDAGYTGPLVLRYQAGDGVDLDEATVAVVPNAVADSPPTVEPGPDLTAAEGSPVTVSATAADDRGAVVTTWSVEGPGCAIAVPTAASTTVTCQDQGAATLTVTADDGVNEPVTASLALTVLNTAPAVEIISGRRHGRRHGHLRAGRGDRDRSRPG